MPGSPGPKAPQEVLAIREALGCLERKVTKASRDWMAFLASKEKQVFLGSLAPRVQPARKGSPAAMESQGRWERRASQVYLEEDSQGFQGAKETKVQRAMWASQDYPGAQEFLDPKENKDSWVPGTTGTAGIARDPRPRGRGAQRRPRPARTTRPARASGAHGASRPPRARGAER